jgi:diguanylate cyclase (GGDEF)-like protein
MKTTTSPLMPLATHTLPWFALLALAVGAAPFAVASETLLRPRLALLALTGLLLEVVLTRVLPGLRQRKGLRVLLDILALLLFATVMSAATGALDSHLLALYLLPLTAAAIALSRFGFGLISLLMLLTYLLLAWLTPVAIVSSAFVIRLIGTLAPALIATGSISVLMRHMQQAEQQIRDLSATDALTGLLNLRAFEQLLEQTHQQAERTGHAYSLAVIDLDNLLEVNSAHGHEAANQMLVAVAQAVQHSIRSADTAARLGGNELAVLLQGAESATANTVAQRIRNAVYAGTISVANRLLRAQVSIGVASFPKDQFSSRQLLDQAVQRMQKDRTLRRPADRPNAPVL